MNSQTRNEGTLAGAETRRLPQAEYRLEESEMCSERRILLNAEAVKTKAEVVQTICCAQSQIRELGVRRLGLFGSFVRGDQHAGSDVDLLVEFEEGQKTFDHFMGLSFLLEDLLGRKVELVTPDALSPHIGPYILREVEYVSLAA
ncbi:MAG TPA: nucleotidyltransferase family protein [Sedimentisphaerales bacterium]|jgi:predicted nucleotidyltransferase|nr:nucleotidyltransferase family protein [Sedimentisphaerales bacterium]HNU30861.1 nucleotidyltransferase family protein [Sedimentisphaerales bacterium]